MGHLINPISTRLGIVRIWNSNWVTFRNSLKYTYLLNKDLYIYSIIKLFFNFECNIFLKFNIYKDIIYSHLYLLRSSKYIYLLCFVYDPKPWKYFKKFKNEYNSYKQWSSSLIQNFKHKNFVNSSLRKNINLFNKNKFKFFFSIKLLYRKFYNKVIKNLFNIFYIKKLKKKNIYYENLFLRNWVLKYFKIRNVKILKINNKKILYDKIDIFYNMVPHSYKRKRYLNLKYLKIFFSCNTLSNNINKLLSFNKINKSLNNFFSIVFFKNFFFFDFLKNFNSNLRWNDYKKIKKYIRRLKDKYNDSNKKAPIHMFHFLTKLSFCKAYVFNIDDILYKAHYFEDKVVFLDSKTPSINIRINSLFFDKSIKNKVIDFFFEDLRLLNLNFFKVNIYIKKFSFFFKNLFKKLISKIKKFGLNKFFDKWKNLKKYKNNYIFYIIDLLLFKFISLSFIKLKKKNFSYIKSNIKDFWHTTNIDRNVSKYKSIWKKKEAFSSKFFRPLERIGKYLYINRLKKNFIFVLDSFWFNLRKFSFVYKFYIKNFKFFDERFYNNFFFYNLLQSYNFISNNIKRYSNIIYYPLIKPKYLKQIIKV